MSDVLNNDNVYQETPKGKLAARQSRLFEKHPSPSGGRKPHGIRAQWQDGNMVKIQDSVMWLWYLRKMLESQTVKMVLWLLDRCRNRNMAFYDSDIIIQQQVATMVKSHYGGMEAWHSAMLVELKAARMALWLLVECQNDIIALYGNYIMALR